jgi:superfamily II DNA or RNA helicase
MSQVQGLDLEAFKGLRQVLSYSVGRQVAYHSGYRSDRRYLLGKKGEFSTGLLGYVKTYFTQIKKPYETIDSRKRPKPLAGLFKATLGYPPHAWQLDALRALIASERGIIVAPTGSGKATVVALAIEAMQVPTLVVVPTLELKKQLTQSLKSTFGDMKHITVENVDALDPKKPPKNIDLLIIDEYHTSATKTYQKLNQKAWNDIYFRLGLTATPYRNRDEEQLLFESILSEVIYQLPHQEAVDKGYIVPLEAYFYELPKIETKGNSQNYRAMVSELIIDRPDRIQLIADIVQRLDTAGESTLVLVKEINHGLKIQQALEDRGLNIAFAHGENDTNRELLLEFNLRERNTLIATGVLGIGVDTKPCSYVILAAGGKSRPQLIQNIGRCLRTYPGKDAGAVIFFRESSHKWFDKHHKTVINIIRDEYNVEPYKL